MRILTHFSELREGFDEKPSGEMEIRVRIGENAVYF
jgi:hypothetical protein